MPSADEVLCHNILLTVGGDVLSLGFNDFSSYPGKIDKFHMVFQKKTNSYKGVSNEGAEKLYSFSICCGFDQIHL